MLLSRRRPRAQQAHSYDELFQRHLHCFGKQGESVIGVKPGHPGDVFIVQRLLGVFQNMPHHCNNVADMGRCKARTIFQIAPGVAQELKVFE